MEQNLDILIVEDEIFIAECIAEILKNAGYRNVRLATNFEDAIKEIELFRPNLVLTDINLGQGKTGIDLGHLLLKQYKISFIYITALSGSEIVDQAMHTCPNAYILKPFKNEDLLVAIELALFNSNNKFEQKCSDSLIMEEGHAMAKLSYNNIMWLEAGDNCTMINNSNGKSRAIQISIADFEAQLNKRPFMRIHQSYMVNCTYITETRSNTLLIDEHELPIGPAYQSSVSSFFNC